MAFINTRFPDSISFGAIGGPGFSTDKVVLIDGSQQRFPNWGELALCTWEVSHAVKNQAQIKELIAFFRITWGDAHTFPFKDWLDYQCLATDGMLGATGIGTGELIYQLYKKYTNAGGSAKRKILLPVNGTLVVYRNGSPVTVGVASGNIAIDYLTGLITFVPDVIKNVNANITKAVSGFTKANPGVANVVAHGFVTGDKIKHASVGGMTQVNDLYVTITAIDADHYSIGVDTTAFGTYTSGGTATKYGITQTNPSRVYSTGHGFSNGQLIWESGATGMTQVNGAAYPVANAAADYFDLSGLDATAFGAYTGSGVLSKGPQPGDTLTAAFEFDVKCCFGTDKLHGEIVKPNQYAWNSIPIIEQRK